MNVLFAILLMSAPFALAALLSWATHRTDSTVRSLRLDVLLPHPDDRDAYRVGHDADAARTRFEPSPSRPTSGAVGERR